MQKIPEFLRPSFAEPVPKEEEQYLAMTESTQIAGMETCDVQKFRYSSVTDKEP